MYLKYPADVLARTVYLYIGTRNFFKRKNKITCLISVRYLFCIGTLLIRRSAMKKDFITIVLHNL